MTKPFTDYLETIVNYMTLSFDFIKDLPPSILLNNNVALEKIQKAKDNLCEDLMELGKIAEGVSRRREASAGRKS